MSNGSPHHSQPRSFPPPATRRRPRGPMATGPDQLWSLACDSCEFLIYLIFYFLLKKKAQKPLFQAKPGFQESPLVEMTCYFGFPVSPEPPRPGWTEKSFCSLPAMPPLPQSPACSLGYRSVPSTQAHCQFLLLYLPFLSLCLSTFICDHVYILTSVFPRVP